MKVLLNTKIMADDDYESEFGATSGASLTEPKQCSGLRKNGYVLMKGRPCRIVEMSTSKPGKHGSAKIAMVGIDIFTGKKYEEISPSTANMEVPHVIRKEYELCDINDGYLTLMAEDCTMKDDIRLPDGELGRELTDKFTNKKDGETVTVCVISAMNEEQPVTIRMTAEK